MVCSSTFPRRAVPLVRICLENCLGDLKLLLNRFADRLEKKGFTKRKVKFRVDAHYAAQVWDISVELKSDSIDSNDDVLQLIEEFHKNNKRI